MSRMRTVMVTAVCTAVLCTAIAFVLGRHKQGIDAYDDVVLRSIIAHAELKVLDADDMSPEEKVAFLAENISTRMAIELMFLRSSPKTDLSLPGPAAEYSISDDEREQTLVRLERYLEERNQKE